MDDLRENISLNVCTQQTIVPALYYYKQPLDTPESYLEESLAVSEGSYCKHKRLNMSSK